MLARLRDHPWRAHWQLDERDRRDGSRDPSRRQEHYYFFLQDRNSVEVESQNNEPEVARDGFHVKEVPLTKRVSRTMTRFTC